MILSKLKSKAILLTLGAICSAATVCADTTLPASGAQAFLPAELGKPLVSEATIKSLQNSNDWGQRQPNSKKFWVAYSDRGDNVTYSQPSTSSSKFSELKFNQKVRIAKVEDGFALVYDEPKVGVSYPQISNEAKSLGWVPMSHLLLWQSCPVNENEIYQKALLVANIDEIGNQSEAQKQSAGSVYFNPETKKRKGNIHTDMTFYFVMKKDPKSGMVLLANQSKTDGSSDKVLYGWVNNNSYVPWNQRSCLEPNWDPDVVSQFNSPAGKKYSFYTDPNLTESGSYYVYGRKNPDDSNERTMYRMQAERARFPLLDNDSHKGNIYKVTSFGLGGRSVNGSTDDVSIEADRKIEKLTKQLQNINLIFVIDGTRSMNKYFASVKDALAKGLSYFDQTKYKPRVGVVIYRDYADGNAMLETQPLVDAKDPRLTSFLQNIGNQGYGATSSPNDHTHTEAMYAGINEALNASKMGFAPDHANLMIVIGDCGNDPADTKSPTQEALVKKLADNNVQLMAHQVLRNSEEPWMLFNIQTRNLITKSLEDQYAKIGAKPKYVKHPNGIGYDLENKDGRNYFIGSMRYAPDMNTAMDPNALSRLIEHNIGDFAKAIQAQIDALVNGASLTGYGSGDVSASDSDMDQKFLESRLGAKLYKELKDRGVMMTFTGYAPKQDSQERKYWKPVVFMSSDEFANLIKRLEPVYRQTEGNQNDRRPYINAIKGLLQAMIPDISDDELNDMDISEATKRINGLNEASAAVKSYTLAQLQDPAAVPENEFRALVTQFNSKYKKLQRINKEAYKYSYTKNGIRYYWIPVEDLP